MRNKAHKNRIVLTLTEVPQVKHWGPQVLQTFDGHKLKTYFTMKGTAFPRFASISYAETYFSEFLVSSIPAKLGDEFEVQIHSRIRPFVKKVEPMAKSE